MSVSSAELVSTAVPVKPVAEEATSTPVLISTAQVLFDTAAARGGHADETGSRFGRMLRRFFETSTDASQAPRHDTPRRYSFIESALMEREMGRL
jgi:hypothetical protein